MRKFLNGKSTFFFMEKQQRPSWVKDKTYAEDFEVIQCPSFDDYKDFKMDNTYVLVRTYPDAKEIGVAICTKDHVILKEFRGKRERDIYYTLFKYMEDHNSDWFSRFDHAAYLGKELKKAEFAIDNNTEYVQE